MKRVAKRPDEPARAAEVRAHEIERNTPPEQQEFDPAFADAGARASSSATASTASAPSSEPAS